MRMRFKWACACRPFAIAAAEAAAAAVGRSSRGSWPLCSLHSPCCSSSGSTLTPATPAVLAGPSSQGLPTGQPPPATGLCAFVGYDQPEQEGSPHTSLSFLALQLVRRLQVCVCARACPCMCAKERLVLLALQQPVGGRACSLFFRRCLHSFASCAVWVGALGWVGGLLQRLGTLDTIGNIGTIGE